MYVNKVGLTNFRNYKSGFTEFSKNINLIYGPNARGKTNVLEALYYLSTARSHRLAPPSEMILFGEEFAKIEASFHSKGRENKSEIILFSDKKKQIKINGIPVEKTSELMGFIKMVLFCPEDLRLVKGSPRDRRRMLDLGICQLKQKYFHSLSEYSKVLRQKNKLLKENPNSEMAWVWNEQLVSLGTDVIWYRKSYIDKISEISGKINKEISDDVLEIIYNCGAGVSDFSHKGKIAEKFRENIEKAKDREKRFGISLVGPHRDDFTIMINGREVRQFGSQGQQRTASVALKMAELETVREVCGENPVLLLDDVLSELDEKRRSYILEKIKDIQVIITSTDADNFSGVKNLYKIFVEDIKKCMCI